MPGGTPIQKQRVLKRTPRRYQDLVLWAWYDFVSGTSSYIMFTRHKKYIKLTKLEM